MYEIAVTGLQLGEIPRLVDSLFVVAEHSRPSDEGDRARRESDGVQGLKSLRFVTSPRRQPNARSDRSESNPREASSKAVPEVTISLRDASDHDEPSVVPWLLLDSEVVNAIGALLENGLSMRSE
jgi:hypothetical protein